jgi:DNA-binding NarL/FixJ family response regulator
MAWRQLVRYAALPQIEILIFTMHDNETLIQELLEAGARGYLLKTDAGRHLIGAIEALAITSHFSPLRSRRGFWIPSFLVPHGRGRL